MFFWHLGSLRCNLIRQLVLNVQFDPQSTNLCYSGSRQFVIKLQTLLGAVMEPTGLVLKERVLSSILLFKLLELMLTPVLDPQDVPFNTVERQEARVRETGND